MTDISRAGTYMLADRAVHRMGYGAMQLAGPGVFGPPKDRDAALAVLREAVASGVDHIDTSDFYGPHVTNQIIKEALHPYPEHLVIVTKVGAKRGEDGSWNPAHTPVDLEAAVHDNLRNLGLERMELVNYRIMPNVAPDLMEAGLTTLAELQQRGLIAHIGVSNATSAQFDAAAKITPIACVQNQYNIADRGDDALVERLAAEGVAYMPFFPLRRPAGGHGEFKPVESPELSAVAKELGATPMQVALAWLLHRSPNIMVIPGTSSLVHLRENLAAASLQLSGDALARLDGVSGTLAA